MNRSIFFDLSRARAGGGRSPRRRGVVLIFTVAVLVLLALIATAYLATARIDRVYVDTKGGAIGQGSAIGGGGGDDLPAAVLEDLRRDVFDVVPVAETAWRYRLAVEPPDPSVATSYRNWDYLFENPAGFTAGTTAENSPSYVMRTRYDPWLASRMPLPYLGGGGFADTGVGTPAWPVISRWVERWNDGSWVFGNETTIGHFQSPLNLTVPLGGPPSPINYTTRHAAIPTWMRIDYDYSFLAPKRLQGQTRTYPALRFDTGPDAGTTFIAGDTDGDGVADAGLFPLDQHPQFADGLLPAGFYVGELPPAAHATRWYAAIRVVDNNGAINVNTAWRRDADLGLAGAYSDVAPTPTGAVSNQGFFRSNIGLLELLKAHPSDTTSLPTEWQTFLNFRQGGANGVIRQTGRNDYELTTLGEALEMNLARRPFNPGNNGGTFRGFDKGLAASLAFANGLINPAIASNLLERALYRNAYQNAPNWAATNTANDAEKAERGFTFFISPPNASQTNTFTPPNDLPMLWWHSLYNPDNASRDGYFTSTFGITPTWAPSIRHLLTTSNPLSTAARPSDLVVAPTWLNPGSANSVAMTPYPGDGRRTQGSINTDPFETLWRDFYQLMADPTNPVVAAVPADLQGGGTHTAYTAAELLQLRAALAAINAVDMRDGDDNITTRRIRLAPPSTKEMMVAGCEQQLFISTITGGGPFQVVLHNPYTTDINGSAYTLAILPTGGGTYANPIVVGGTIPAGGNSSPIDVQVTGVTSGDLVLLRTRRADGTKLTNNAGPNQFDEAANIHDLVPVDIVVIGTLPSGTTAYARDLTEWRVASAGTNISAPGTTSNPFALLNMPGVNKAIGAMPYHFPFGGFARKGDMMLIPYIGTYVIYPTGSSASVVDATPITLDVDKLVTAPAAGQIKGRFTPSTGGLPSDDWRSRIVENFTTLHNPMNDYFPNMAPESWREGATGTAPVQVTGNDPDVADNLSGVHGLININTAGYDVLRMVPFVVNTSAGPLGQVDVAANDAVVGDILLERRMGGPFKSVMDMITRVGGFSGSMTPAPANGHFMTDTSTVITTYANTYNSYNRVSNLLTTRSDSFTVYVLLQQWQDFGTSKPVLLTESRYGAVIDRSQLSDVKKAITDIVKESVATQ